MKLRSVVLAFAIAGFAPSIPTAETGTQDNPRIVGEGVTFVPGGTQATDKNETVIVTSDNKIPVPFPKPIEERPVLSFGKSFMASMPQVDCSQRPAQGNALEEIEKFLCDSTDPKKMTTHELIDQFHANGLTDSHDFAQFKNAYTRFLNNYNTPSSVEDRIERTRAVVGNLYALISTPKTEVTIHWKNRVNWWMKGLNDFQYGEPQYNGTGTQIQAQLPQAQPVFIDNSRAVTNDVYTNLQNLAYSREYTRLQGILRNNGAYYREDNQQAEVFMNLIKSGYYNNDFQARTNLSVCAGYALLRLSENLGLSGNIAQTAWDTVRRMNDATQGKAPQTDCRAVYFTYR